MRIALIVHKFPPASLGGTEIYTRNLAQALSRKHDVFVFHRDDANGQVFHEEWQNRDGFRAWRVNRGFDAAQAGPTALFSDTFFNPDVEKSFSRFLDEVQPDAVHFQHLMSLSYRLIAQAKQRGLPCLLTLHDYWFICSNSQLIWPDAQICKGQALGLNCVRCATARISKPWMTIARPLIAPVFQLRDAVVRQAALRADQLIAPSQFLIDRYVKEDFPADRFVFVENGLDVDRIRTRERRQPMDGKLHVTYLGSLAWQKGVHVLVDAFRDLPPERVELRVFGNPNVFPRYAADLRQRANGANTSFEGTVPNEEVGQVLADTHILAVPSLWYENSPVVIQEARAAVVPVIASAHGALVEKVQDGVDGLLVPPGDASAWRAALQRLADEPGLLAHLRANARPPMTLEDHVDQLESLYSRLLDVNLRRVRMSSPDQAVSLSGDRE